MVRFLDDDRSGQIPPCPLTRCEQTPFPAQGGSPLLALGSSSSNNGFVEVHIPFMDLEPSRRLALAYIEPAYADPGLFIRLALEQHVNPPFTLAASSRGAMVVTFRHPYYREEAIRRSPLRVGDAMLVLERHGDADFRYMCRYRYLVEVAALDFHLEHWTQEHITAAFRAIGNVCCVDPDCLWDTDYSTVRVLLLMDDVDDVLDRLLLRNFDSGLGAVVRLRVVDF